MKKNKKKEKGTCTYCGKTKETTRDHVPPESFFPKPKPSNLITVPSCVQCNRGAGKDEEFFLATFMFSEAGVSEVGKKLWDEKLKRMFQKNRGLKKRIAKSLNRSEIYTSAGIYLGRKMTIDTDRKRFYKVVSKVVRGLYFFEYSQALSEKTEVSCRFLQDNEESKLAIPHLDSLVFGTRQWPGNFEYRFNRVSDEPEESMWLIRFFNYAIFLAVSSQVDAADNC